MTDSEIIAAVQAGNRDVFGTLVERYQRTLYYFVIGKVAEDTEAKDIVQKSFVATSIPSRPTEAFLRGSGESHLIIAAMNGAGIKVTQGCRDGCWRRNAQSWNWLHLKHAPTTTTGE